jgi:hypothetical protein
VTAAFFLTVDRRGLPECARGAIERLMPLRGELLSQNGGVDCNTLQSSPRGLVGSIVFEPLRAPAY